MSSKTTVQKENYTLMDAAGCYFLKAGQYKDVIGISKLQNDNNKNMKLNYFKYKKLYLYCTLSYYNC